MIALEEEGLYDRAQFYGTDLTPRSIERAKSAVYPASSVAQFAVNYRESGGKTSFSEYYGAAYDRIAFVESLKRNIVFFQHDLVGDHTLGGGFLCLGRSERAMKGDLGRSVEVFEETESIYRAR